MSYATLWSPLRLFLKADRPGLVRRRLIDFSFIRRQAANGLLAALMLFVLSWWYFAFIGVADSHSKVRLHSLTATVSPGAPVELGRVELGQNDHADSAEIRHVRLVRLPGGGLEISNVSARHRLSLTYQSGLEVFADSFPLHPKTQIFAAHMVLSIDSAEDGVLVFKLNGSGGEGQPRSFRASAGIFGASLQEREPGSNLYRALPQCGKPTAWWSLDGPMRAVRSYISSKVPQLSGRDTQIAAFGGLGFPPGFCESGGVSYFAEAGLPWRALRIVFSHNVFFLEPGETVSPQDIPVRFVTPDKRVEGFTKISWSFDQDPSRKAADLKSVVIGRTSYDILVDKAHSTVTFSPSHAIAMIPPEQAKATADASASGHTSWQPRFTAALPLLATPGWLSPGSLLRGDSGFRASSDALPSVLSRPEQILRLAFVIMTISLVAALCGIPGHLWRIIRRRQVDPDGNIPLRHRWLPVMLTLVSAALALSPDVAVLSGFDMPAQLAIQLMMINWGLASLALLWSGGGLYLSLLWLAVLVMTAVGSLSLVAMAVDGDSTRWLEFFGKHKLLFLDLVPPFIVAVSLAPLRSMRPVVEELITGSRPGPLYRLVRWLPTGLLVIAFGMWALVGGQLGLPGFQPVEAGKFAVCVICASVLIGLGSDARRATFRMSWVRRIIAPVSVLVFLGLLVSVPVLRSDYSPALIMALLVGGLMLIAILPALAGVFHRAYERHKAFWEIPLVFRAPSPRGKRPGFFIAGTIVAILALSPLWVPRVTGLGLWLFLNVWSIPADRQAALTKLECALGRGRFVPIERFIAWKDLAFGTDSPSAETSEVDRGSPSSDNCDSAAVPLQPAKTGDPAGAGQDPPTARFRDLEYQIIRSRVLLAHAACGLDPQVLSAMPFRESLGEIIERFSLLPRAIGIEGLCASFRPGDTTSLADCYVRPTTPTERTGPPLRRSLLSFGCGDLLRLPVVQTDFAPTFLMARFGLVSGAILYAGQALFVICCVAGFVRLRRGGSANSADRSLRAFLATVLAGAMALFVLHWSISWCNVLGLLPVMGQPMTLLSAATSHHLFMTLPCLVVIVVAFRFAGFKPQPLNFGVPPRL